MAVENLKAVAITNLDASPIVANTAGHGAPALVHHIDGFATVSAAASIGSTYQLVRLPSKAIVKSVVFESEAQGAGQFQVSAYYSDSTVDGTTVANQGLVVPTTGAAFFSAVINCAAAVNATEVVNAASSYSVDKRQKQLWDALGLTTDPGGFFDVVAVVNTAAVTTGTGRISVRVGFVYG